MRPSRNCRRRAAIRASMAGPWFTSAIASKAAITGGSRRGISRKPSKTCRPPKNRCARKSCFSWPRVTPTPVTSTAPSSRVTNWPTSISPTTTSAGLSTNGRIDCKKRNGQWPCLTLAFGRSHRMLNVNPKDYWPLAAGHCKLPTRFIDVNDQGESDASYQERQEAFAADGKAPHEEPRHQKRNQDADQEIEGNHRRRPGGQDSGRIQSAGQEAGQGCRPSHCSSQSGGAQQIANGQADPGQGKSGRLKPLLAVGLV